MNRRHKRNARYSSIFFVIVDPIKNMGNIRDYFIAQTHIFITFHFFAGYDNRKSYLTVYRDGKKVYEQPLPSYTGSNHVLKLASNYVLFVSTLIRYVPSRSWVIIANPIFCIGHGLFSAIRRLKYVFWIGDYYPDAHGFMKIYNALVARYNRTLEYVLYESPPVDAIYRKLSGQAPNRKLVPLGLKQTASYKHLPGQETVLGFIGVIRKGQGLDLVFRYLQQAEHTRLEIIGDGYWLPYYKKLAQTMKISKRVTFFGYVEDVTDLIRHWDIGLALYENSSTNVSKYCEPTKIKDYLELHVPVITTKTTYFHKELASAGAGIAINETTGQLSRAVKTIMKNKEKFYSGIAALVAKYEYISWYRRKLSFLEEC